MSDQHPQQIKPMIPSSEQLAIITRIKECKNVMVNAVAGSGKTTTVLSLANECPDKNILQFTYNSNLRAEVRDKIELYSEVMMLDKITVHTYHSFAYEYYTHEAKTDLGINLILEKNLQPIKSLPPVDILVLDEVQDMTGIYFKLVNKIRDDANIKQTAILCVMGDVLQGLYEFKGADVRFLSLAWEIWDSPYTWRLMQLSTSYRLTEPMANFINQALIGKYRIRAPKAGIPVMYIRNINGWATTYVIANKLIEMIKSGQTTPENIFILAPSVKAKKSPIKLLENLLVAAKIPCYVPMRETGTLDADFIRGKVIFSSIHQSKGRERDIVVACGFDRTHYDYFNRDAPIDECTSSLYVQVTRARKLLILVETDDPVPCLQMPQSEIAKQPWVNFVGIPLAINSIGRKKPKFDSKIPMSYTSPTDLIKFLDERIFTEINGIIRDNELFNTHSKFGTNIKIINKVEFGNLFEEVSDINGIAIPARFQEVFTKKPSAVKCEVMEYLETCSETDYYKYALSNVDFNSSPMTIEDELLVSTAYQSIQEGLHFKLKQIREYNWIDDLTICELFKNMAIHIENPTNLNFEVDICSTGNNSNQYDKMDAFIDQRLGTAFNRLRFGARVDAIGNGILWEFKCVTEFQIEHMIQLIIYAWLCHIMPYSTDNMDDYEYKLMNICTGEVLILNKKWDIIDNIMVAIIQGKYAKRRKITDDEFIELYGITETMEYSDCSSCSSSGDSDSDDCSDESECSNSDSEDEDN